MGLYNPHCRPLAPVLVPMCYAEIQLQARLSEGHVGLVRLESALLSRTHLGLVMEYVDGGTLTNFVSQRGPTRLQRGGLHVTEDEARYFFRQIIGAVEYLHTQ
jgi:serine/threonine-protein kinase SRK2